MVKATWAIEIDWNNDLDFSDTGEVVTSRVLNEPGIVTVRGRDQVRALAPPMAGRCDVALNNASKDYSPDYTGGPLYGNLLPGRAIRIRTSSPSATDIWRGHLDDLPQEPFARGGGRVRVPGLGTLARLKGVAVSTALYTNIATSTAFGHVCAAAGLAASEYSALDTGKTTLAYWWCAEDDAFAMLLRILAAEGPGAAIYERGDGVIAFHSRHYRLLTSRSATSQATFGNAATEPRHSPPFGYEPNLKGVVNSASVAVSTLAFAGTLSDLQTFALDPPVTLNPSQSVDIPVLLSAVANIETIPLGSGFIEIPTLTFDDQSGAYSATANRVSGQAFVLTVTSAATFAFTFSAVTIRGYASTTTSRRIASTVDTSASRAKYGVRSLPTSYSPWPYITATQALDLANSAVSAYQEPRATIAVTVHNANATRLAQQLARDISDRITVQESQTGIGGDVFIEQVRHEVREGGRFHRTTFGCEKVNAAYDDWFIFDADNFDDESFGF